MKRVCKLATFALVLFALISPIHRTVAKERIRVLTNPRVSLNGYSIYNASAKQNDPRAQDPEYIYLVIDQDAVRLTGPHISASDGINVNELFFVENPTFRFINRRPYSADGIRVTVNPRLVYEIYAKDYEFEVKLARVKLIKQDGRLKTRFVFAAMGDGVSHAMQISVRVDGTRIRTAPPFTIEARND
jgi:hypothetical protein